VFSDAIHEDARNLTLIGITLIALGLLLLLAEHLADHTRTLEDKTWRDAAVVGLAQAAALIPGVSRSGATITAGLFLGFERAAAARFSFLLSVPAVVLSGLYELRELGGEGAVGFVPTALATIFAFVSGYAAIAFLLKFLVTHTTAVFVVYRVMLGIVVLALVGTDVIS
jgi:undecaprenyl-diphosphatase